LDKSQPTKNFLTLIFLALIWGSSYILMKKGLVSFSAIQVASLRILISAIVLLPFLRKIQKKDWIFIAIVAFFGSGIPTFIYPLAITKIDSNIAGIINSLTPVFTMIFGVLLFKTQIKIVQVIGLLISFIGAAILILYGTSGESFSFSTYALIAVLAPLFYGFSSNVLKAKLNHIHALSLTANTFVLLFPFALIILLLTDFFQILKTDAVAYVSLSYIAVLAILGTAFALVIFNFLIKKTSAIYASSVTFLMPIVVLMWGFLSGEIIGIFHFIGLSLILMGVYLLNYFKK